MPVNENHQTNTIREAFLKDSIVIKKDKLVLLITYLCFWTNIFDIKNLVNEDIWLEDYLCFVLSLFCKWHFMCNRNIQFHCSSILQLSCFFCLGAYCAVAQCCCGCAFRLNDPPLLISCGRAPPRAFQTKCFPSLPLARRSAPRPMRGLAGAAPANQERLL